MFEQTFVQSQAQTRKPWTVAVSLSLQCLVVGALLLIPLLHPQALLTPKPPQPRVIRTWITQPPPPPQTERPRAAILSAPVTRRTLVYVPQNAHPAASPSVGIPSTDQDSVAWSGPLSTTFGGPSFGDTTQLPPRAVAQPRTPPVAQNATTGPLKISQGVQGAKLLFSPHPAYPPLAKITHTQGIVKLEATIAADGSIRNLRVVSGPPLLIDAAVDAVRQWRYSPTLLNGVAVEVLTEIDVSFTLTQ
jgi:protein TonB